MSSLRILLVSAALLSANVSWAQPPAPIHTQVPGYFRLAVGDYEVTALFDGYNDLGPSLLEGLAPEKIRQQLVENAVDPERMQTSFNAFVVNTGKHLVLVDSGAGHCLPQTAGSLESNLRASGYKPEQIDTVLLTHMHLDHVCGLVTESGKALFPNAQVYATKAEADYWLSPQEKAKAPAGGKEYFDIAVNSLKPYRDAGRFKTFTPPQPPIREVEVIARAGHTPGSVTYRFESGGKAIVFIGDLIHSAAVQFDHPEVSIHFDTKPEQAIASRKEEFNDLAKRGEWLAAAHLPFPGIGHLTINGQAYRWVPALFGPYQRAAEVPLLK
ncbi:MBL fold metallo-hydrolase [Pseudomonas sp. NY15349]|uniref:MBL fold metallo-hydrolase n=1 Tax=Pseudomonas sp. NY15349 TaxID=3400350 RepID=UPI003A83DF3F